ncbi:hypothetical protein A33Q_0096 [Indibacter alkaliphilus LW1]|uniref:Uncharacterized protein n=1 Tax=Indibacter alkaliphilus (strain CCUG 57479 / KCTC 22604 / LW1) TaxID=1189612 RepID=S2DT97_INDAL|nr:hypothetical protein A33Q_0096 [Indibacter alkaliphilus LW1]
MSDFAVDEKFQFLYGAIEGALRLPAARPPDVFQFLYGAIEG